MDGVAFFGTPYVLNDPARSFAEMRRVLKPGGIASGAFNGAESRWTGRLYTFGQVKEPGEKWHFDCDIIKLFQDEWQVIYWARHGDEYYYLSALKVAA